MVTLVAVALWLAGAGDGWCHDLGTVQVYGVFLKGGTYHLDVVVDEEHLRAAQAGGPPHSTRYGRIAGLGEPASSHLGRFLSDLADATTLSFDGREVAPDLEIAPPELGGPAQRPGRAVLRFSGEIPGGVHTFTWNNGLPLGRYPVALRNEGEEGSLWQWLEGGKPSPPFRLAPGVVPPPAPPLALVATRYFRLGFGDVLPRGSDAILFMVGLALLCMRMRPLLAQAAAFAAAYGLGLMAAAPGSGPGAAGFLGASSPGFAAALAALTLLLLALDNLWRVRGGRLLAAPGRLVLVVGCGLVQGMVGGGSLARGGLPRPRLGAALASYSLGSAVAMAAVLGAAFLLFGASFRLQPWYRRRVVVPGSVLIAAAGIAWSLQTLL